MHKSKGGIFQPFEGDLVKILNLNYINFFSSLLPNTFIRPTVSQDSIQRSSGSCS